MAAGNRPLTAICALMLGLSAPVSLDPSTGEFIVKMAHAGKGDGNSGQGKGNGGPNGSNPGNGNNGNGQGGDTGGSDGDDGGDPPTPTYPDTVDEGSGDSGDDPAADLADIDFNDAVSNTEDAPLDGPAAGSPLSGLPTVQQLFSSPDTATISLEEELELIRSGWRSN